MELTEKGEILRALLQDCITQVDEKERRMRIYVAIYEYPGMQRAENIDRAISGFLAPLTALRPRRYTEKRIKEEVDTFVKLIMEKFFKFKDECLSLLKRLENGKLGEDEISKYIIKVVNTKEVLFKPTVADLQMAADMGDLDKYGYEVTYDQRGKSIITKKKSS